MNKRVLNNIIAIRKSLGYSQDYVSEMLNMEQSNYGKIERGSIGLTYAVLLKLSEIFKIRLIDIITYPEKYVSTKDLSINTGDAMEAVLQIRLGKEKKDQVLKIVFGENNLEILNK